MSREYYPTQGGVIDLRSKIRTPASKTKAIYEELERISTPPLSKIPRKSSPQEDMYEMERWAAPRPESSNTSQKLPPPRRSMFTPSRIQDFSTQLEKETNKPYWRYPAKLEKLASTSKTARILEGASDEIREIDVRCVEPKDKETTKHDEPPPRRRATAYSKASQRRFGEKGNLFSVHDDDLTVDDLANESTLQKTAPLPVTSAPAPGFLSSSPKSPVATVYTFASPILRGPQRPRLPTPAQVTAAPPQPQAPQATATTLSGAEKQTPPSAREEVVEVPKSAEPVTIPQPSKETLEVPKPVEEEPLQQQQKAGEEQGQQKASEEQPSKSTEQPPPPPLFSAFGGFPSPKLTETTTTTQSVEQQPQSSLFAGFPPQKPAETPKDTEQSHQQPQASLFAVAKPLQETPKPAEVTQPSLFLGAKPAEPPKTVEQPAPFTGFLAPKPPSPQQQEEASKPAEQQQQAPTFLTFSSAAGLKSQPTIAFPGPGPGPFAPKQAMQEAPKTIDQQQTSLPSVSGFSGGGFFAPKVTNGQSTSFGFSTPAKIDEQPPMMSVPAAPKSNGQPTPFNFSMPKTGDQPMTTSFNFSGAKTLDGQSTPFAFGAFSSTQQSDASVGNAMTFQAPQPSVFQAPQPSPFQTSQPFAFQASQPSLFQQDPAQPAAFGGSFGSGGDLTAPNLFQSSDGYKNAFAPDSATSNGGSNGAVSGRKIIAAKRKGGGRR